VQKKEGKPSLKKERKARDEKERAGSLGKPGARSLRKETSKVKVVKRINRETPSSGERKA